jgi:hypothetical protein
MRRILFATAVVLAALVLPVANAAGGGGARGATPKTQSFWLCFLERYEQGVAAPEAALDCHDQETAEAPADAEPSGLMGPFGTAVGGPAPGWSDVQVSCGGGDSRIADGGGEPATKAEIDQMMMAKWKEYLEARQAQDTPKAEKAYADYEKLKLAKGYANQEVEPISKEQCEELAAGLRELSHQVQVCAQKGWQSSSMCRQLAATFFGCADPTVSLTTGDYECGGKPSQAELDAAAQRAYELCSQLRQGGGTDTDPCKPIAVDRETVRSVLVAHDVCNNPYARWEGTCGGGDLGEWLDGLVRDLSPSVVDTLDVMCAKLGQSECWKPPSGGSPPSTDPEPRPGDPPPGTGRGA